MRTSIREARFKKYYAEIHENGRMMFAGRLLQRAAKLFPDTTALICKDVEISFSTLYTYALRTTRQLLDLGVKPHDRVCLLFENSIEYYVAYYGIWQTGAVVAPLNTFVTERELAHIIADAQPVALVVSEDFFQRLESLKQLGIVLPQVVMQPPLTFEENHIRAHDDVYEIPAVDPDAMAALLYTSGTTGVPKGVMLSSKNILTNVAQVISTLEFGKNDRLFGVLPLFHSFAQNTCVWSGCFIGAGTIVVPKIERTWILDGFRHQPTVMIGVPTLYGLLCMMKHLEVSTVRYFCSGGDAMPDKVRAAFELVYQRKLVNGYGLTECSPFVAADTEDELKATSTIGHPALGLEVSLRDEKGNEVPRGEVGILWIKGDNVMLGYYNAPEATAEVLREGWLNTGDFAYLDSDGRLAIAGRFKDLIISKGFNIYPPEIENILMTHPLVFKAGVIGKEDEATGEIPIAFVAVKSQEPGLEQTLKKLCMQHLAAYKVPRHIICLPDLPMTALGKVDKKKLKKEYETIKSNHS